MLAYQNARAVPFGAVTLYRIIDAADRLLTAIRGASVARRTRKSLEELSDFQLADIGITRAEIDAVANRAAGF